VLNLFRRPSLLAGIMLFIIALLLRTPAFLHLAKYEFIQTAPFARLFFGYWSALPNIFFWSLMFNGILLFLQAMFLNYIVNSQGILYKNTFLPGLVFLIINSFFLQQNELTPHLISNTFLLLLFQRLCYLYESPNPLLVVLDAGLYLGVGVLFNYDLLVFLPFILISVVLIRSFNIRYLIISIIGLFLPLYFTGVYFYTTDRFAELWLYIIQSFETKNLMVNESDSSRLAPWAIVVPIIAVAVFNLQQNFFRNKVKTRRIIQMVYLFLPIGFASVFLDNNNYMYSIIYGSVPISILIGYYFISERRFWLKEVLFLTLLFMCFFFQLR
jgi:hypothetical protein